MSPFAIKFPVTPVTLNNHRGTVPLQPPSQGGQWKFASQHAANCTKLVACLTYARQGQGRSQNTADARAQHGHTVFVRTSVPENAEAILEFLSFLGRF